MGMRAQLMFQQHNVRVVVGATSGTPEELALAYVNNQLEAGENLCDH